MMEAAFHIASRLFGLQFKELHGLPVYHPDVTVYEVTRKGKHVGLWYFDPFARAGKRSGAWMNAYRRQEKADGNVTTIVSNNSNFVKGAEGEPVLHPRISRAARGLTLIRNSTIRGRTVPTVR